MVNTEFTNQFDVLYNNVTSNQAPGLNEYEKSVFLTKALNEILKNYFLASHNTKQEGYGDTKKRDLDFSRLIKTTELDMYDYVNNEIAFDPRAFKVEFRDATIRPLFIINEILRITGVTLGVTKGIRQVIPIRYDEYTRLMSKPYKEPLKNQAWRLVNSTDYNTQLKTSFDIIVRSADIRIAEQSSAEEGEGNPAYDFLRYRIRYIRRPIPIILENFLDVFGEDISIDGYNGSESVYNNGFCCELDPAIHEEILQRAVELAKVAWAGDANEIQLNMTAGQRSE